jgi:hypothetical protein
VPTNRALLELIACLAQRVEECCGPNPTATFRIAELTVGNRDETESLNLTDFPPKDFPQGMEIPQASNPATITIRFTGDKLDPNSVVLGTNLVITDANGVEPPLMPPDISSTQIRLKLIDGIFRGAYKVTVSGDGPDPVTSTAGIRLNAEFPKLPSGELTQLPSGDDAPGGVFLATFNVQ